MIGIYGYLFWSKTLMELIFNPVVNFGEVRRVQLPNPLTSPLRWCPWDLLRYLKVSSGAKERMGCGKQREATAPIQSLVKLQPWFLRLRWKTCLRQNCSLGSCAFSEGPALGQKTLMMMMMIFLKTTLCYKLVWMLWRGFQITRRI